MADPLSRVPFLASRKVNIVFHFAEALWYLWGRSDLEMMAYYAPQMRSYSMDGKTLRGSAYGARLFRAPPGAGPSAFDVVLSLQVLSEAQDPTRTAAPFTFPVMPRGASWADLEAVELHEERLRANRSRYTPGTIADTGLNR